MLIEGGIRGGRVIAELSVGVLTRQRPDENCLASGLCVSVTKRGATC